MYPPQKNQNLSTDKRQKKGTDRQTNRNKHSQIKKSLRHYPFPPTNLFLPQEKGERSGGVEVLLVVVLQSGHVLLGDPVDEEGRHEGEEADEGPHGHHNAKACLRGFLRGVGCSE